MALVLNDRVKETSITTGTGTVTLAGAVSGFDTFFNRGWKSKYHLLRYRSQDS